MTLLEIGAQYDEAAKALGQRIRELRAQHRAADDPDTAWHLQRRIEELIPLRKEAKQLSNLCLHYYERSFWRNLTISAPTENGKKVLTMSLDITIKERKEFRCPDCGRLVTTQDIDEVSSSGRVWYDFLESVGYYVPYEKRAKENDWYGLDMVISGEQAKQLADFVSDNLPYKYQYVESLVARALLHGNKVVINADW